MKTYYATITKDQYPYLLKGKLGGYIEIKNCNNRNDASKKIMDLLGTKWSFMYKYFDNIHELDRNLIATIE